MAGGSRGGVAYEQDEDDAAFDAHREALYLAAFRERREKDGLTEGAVDGLREEHGEAIVQRTIGGGDND